MDRLTEPTPRQRREAADIFRDLWWSRALLHTEHSPFGAVLRAAMQIQQGKAGAPQRLVCFGPGAILMDDDAPECVHLTDRDGSGIVWTNVLYPEAIAGRTEPICTVKRLVAHVQQTVDDLAFTQAEASALAAVVQAWIRLDHRKNIDGAAVEDRIPADQRDKD